MMDWLTAPLEFNFFRNALVAAVLMGLVSGALPQHFIPYKADFEHRRERAVEGYQLLKTACASPNAQ